jgi:hypothetical protein
VGRGHEKQASAANNDDTNAWFHHNEAGTDALNAFKALTAHHLMAGTCLHGAKLSSKRAADASRQDDRGHHRSQLSGKRQSQHTTHTARQPQLGKLPHKLDKKRGASQGARERVRVRVCV